MSRIACGIACSIVVLGLIALRDTPATAQDKERSVWLVRHAEKVDESVDSPLKQPEGGARAKALAVWSADKNIGTIITSSKQRTIKTAEEVVKDLKKSAKPFVVLQKDAFVSVISEAKKAPGNVLVVHHSPDLPKIIKGLGSPKSVTICGYDRVFEMQMAKQPAAPVVSSYGAPSPGCPPLQAKQ